jgi:hypothetical protein
MVHRPLKKINPTDQRSLKSGIKGFTSARIDDALGHASGPKGGSRRLHCSLSPPSVHSPGALVATTMRTHSKYHR